MLTTEAGKIAWQAQLDVYGVVREEPLTAGGLGADAAPEAERTSNPWRYPGQYEDAETGLYYHRVRYYDPETGRYLSEDPIGLAGGAQLFGYVSDPLFALDPWGLKTRTSKLRSLWEDLTGSPAKNQIHHGLPEEMAEDFGKPWVDVNNPKYFFDLSPEQHNRLPDGIHTKGSPLGKEWNAAWKEWMASNRGRLRALGPKAKQVIERRLAWMANKAGISKQRARPGCK